MKYLEPSDILWVDDNVGNKGRKPQHVIMVALVGGKLASGVGMTESSFLGQ